MEMIVASLFLLYKKIKKTICSQYDIFMKLIGSIME